MKFSTSAAVALVVFALAGFAHAQKAGKGGKTREKPVSGKIVSVADGKVTLSVKAAKGAPKEEKEFATDAQTVVKLDGKDAKVTDLLPKMTVKITAAKDGKPMQIVATSPKGGKAARNAGQGAAGKGAGKRNKGA